MAEQHMNTSMQEESENTGGITIHDIIQMILVNWYWFALSVLFCMGAAYFYLAKTPRIYNRTATILVKDSRKGGEVDLATFSDLAGFQTMRSVDNEVFILQSRRLMENVVRKLSLTQNYSTSEHLREKNLYGENPIEVKFIDDNQSQNLSLEATPLEDGKIQLSAFTDYVADQVWHTNIKAQLGDTVSSPIGQLVVSKTLYMSPEYLNEPIFVSKTSLVATTNAYRNAVKSDVANKQASVVIVSMNNANPKRAEDVINTLIEEYNDDAIADKRRISEVTAEFIKLRLKVIGEELGDVDQNIENIKKDNQMVDLMSEGARNITERSQYKAEGLSIENQINVAEFIRAYLLDASKSQELIPMMATVANASITSQIEAYNAAILRREKLRENSSARNPVIQELDNNLAAVRRSIIASLESHISTLDIQRNTMQGEESKANRRITAMPSQEKVILSIMRQQKIKEELFLYLLNKQEETQLNSVVAESNARTIDSAYGSSTPVSPRPMTIFFIGLFAGVTIPFLIIYLTMMLDTTIRGRKDVEDNLSAPFLGSIPLYEIGGHGLIAVRETGRDMLSESFRMLRSNMSFMNVSSQQELKTVLFTSTNPHAGKTFVAANLAMTLAMAGKRVIIIDLDLRRHSLSDKMGEAGTKKGISTYLSAGCGIEEIISTTQHNKNLDIIYSGVQPPNPAEMLLSEKLDALIATLRERYDYIFIDSPPAMAVSDAITIGRFSDLCIYIVREGVLDRRQLPEIERMHRDKRLGNMAIVLNGAHSRKHGYGYGYGYGYAGGYYGYGYGDGDGYGDEVETLSFRVRILKFIRKK